MEHKKWIALLITAALMLSLAACGGRGTASSEDSGNIQQSSALPNSKAEITPTPIPTPTPQPTSTPAPTPIPLVCGDKIENDNFLMTFDSMEILSEYSYEISEHFTIGLYVEEGYKLLLVKGHFDNKSTSVISTFPNKMFAFTVTVNNEYVVDGYDVRFEFVRANSSEIDPYTDFDYLLYINIPEKLAGMFETATFTVRFNDDLSSIESVYSDDGTETTQTDHTYAFISSTGDNSNASSESSATESMPTSSGEPSMDTIEIGDTITTDEYEFTLKNVELTYKLLPSDTSSVYTSYPAESGKVYVHVAASVKNLMKRDIRIDETFSVGAIYSDDYKYSGFVVVDVGNRFDWVNSYSAATPLETANMHGLVECPIEVDKTDEKLVTIITLSNDVSYQYVIR